jgi:hypothetical protein
MAAAVLRRMQRGPAAPDSQATKSILGRPVRTARLRPSGPLCGSPNPVWWRQWQSKEEAGLRGQPSGRDQSGATDAGIV